MLFLSRSALLIKFTFCEGKLVYVCVMNKELLLKRENERMSERLVQCSTHCRVKLSGVE